MASSKEETEEALRVAYKRLGHFRETREDFARLCQVAHAMRISDGEIVKLIGGGYSRSRIQQYRKEQEKRDKLHEQHVNDTAAGSS